MDILYVNNDDSRGGGNNISVLEVSPSGALLVAQVQRCCLCPGVAYTHTLSAANGSPNAQAMFIAEAPGRLGAAVTGVPLTRDQSGRRFGRLLVTAGIPRAAAFITNAVLCNPLDGRGRNRRPSAHEVANCARWLRAQIELVRPQVVVTLGTVALAALRSIERHTYVLRRDVGRALPWHGRLLVPLYHPSPRAARHRPYAQQVEDFRRLGELVREVGRR